MMLLISIVDKEGRTIFYVACLAGKTEILDYLLECGIPEDYLHKKSGFILSGINNSYNTIELRLYIDV